MIRKQEHPPVQVKELITVENQTCVVSKIYGAYCLLGVCEVVTDRENPVNRDIFWDGGRWLFSERPVIFNAVKSSRLKEFVEILQQAYHP